MARLVVCERHGLGYDADQYAACPDCRTTVGGLQAASPRPSQLDTQRREPIGPTGAPRDASTTRRPDGRTTAHGGRRTQPPDAERPRFAPVVRPAPAPPSARVYGPLALGWLAVMAVLVHRQWWGQASGTATAGEATASASAPSGETDAPTPAPASARRRKNAAAEVSLESERGAASRRWPMIRERGRAGELPELCRTPRPATYAGSPESKTPLMVAAESGTLEALQLALASGAELDARDSLQRTALMYAAHAGRTAHVDALLLAGADARTRGLWDASSGWMTATDAAQLGDHEDTVQRIQRDILQSFVALDPSDLSALDEAGNTPLHWVSSHADARAAQLLIDRGADLEAQNCPARQGDERGPHQDDLHSATPLLVALWAENPAVARQLLAAKANVRARDERGRGVFHLLRNAESVALTQDLLRAGADPKLRDHDGQTPLDALAAVGLRAELLRELAAAGQPVPTPPASLEDLFGLLRRIGRERDDTPESEAAAPVIALLESDPLLVSQTDAQGRTALFEAAAQGLSRIAEALLARGASANARDRGGRSPLHLARDGSSVRTLVNLGASVDLRDASGTTPLQLHAATPGALDAVKALIEAGANPRLVDARRRSALDLARATGSPDVAEYLERGL